MDCFWDDDLRSGCDKTGQSLEAVYSTCELGDECWGGRLF